MSFRQEERETFAAETAQYGEVFAIDGGYFFGAEFFAKAHNSEIDQINIVIREAGGKFRDALPVFIGEWDWFNQAEVDQLGNFAKLTEVPRGFSDPVRYSIFSVVLSRNQTWSRKSFNPKFE